MREWGGGCVKEWGGGSLGEGLCRDEGKGEREGIGSESP